MCNNYGIIAKPTTSHNPQANSIIKHVHKVVNEMLRSFDLEKETLEEDNPFDYFLQSAMMRLSTKERRCLEMQSLVKLLGKLSIPKFDESFDEALDEGKKMFRNAELSEVAYTELNLSINVKSNEDKVSLIWSKDARQRNILMVNATNAWERLKNKFEPVSAPSMVKLEKHLELYFEE